MDGRIGLGWIWKVGYRGLFDMRGGESLHVLGDVCLIAVLAVFNEILLWPDRLVILVRIGMTFYFHGMRIGVSPGLRFISGLEHAKLIQYA
jgi:hypothetical protein